MSASLGSLRRKVAMLVAVGLAVPLALIAVPGAATAEPATVIVDDSTTSGTNRFEFGAGWNAGTGLDLAKWNAGTEHWAKSADRSAFTFTFTGEQARLFGIKDVPHGKYAISVDDGTEVVVDAYAPTRSFKQLLFDTGALPTGTHTVKLRLTGEKNAAASRADGQIDFAEVIAQRVPVTGVEMDESPIELVESATRQLEASVVPAGATDASLRWSSSAESVATVSATGYVTAVAAGTATITATTVDGGFTTSRDVTVTAAPTTLSGAVGETNFHYTTTKYFDDYRRKYLSDVIGMTGTEWSDTAWRNDRVSGQFVLWTGAEAKTGVRVESATLVGASGVALDANGLDVNFVDAVMAGRGRPSLGKPQEPIPDVLSTVASVDVVAHTVQPLWLIVDVPADAAAGQYTGEVVVVDDQGERITFDLGLEVLDLELPAAGDWDQFIDLWQNPYAVARVSGIPANQLWTRAHFDAMLPHYQRLRDAGQDVITATVVNDPWASQTYDPYGSMVKWTKKTDGTWAFDFTVFDQWVTFMMDEVGIDGQIDAYSMVNWASKVQYLDAATGQKITASVPVGSAIWTEMWSAFLEAFGPHLQEKGWFDRTYMAMDERALGDLMYAVDLIDAHAPGLKVGAAMNYNSLTDPRLDRIDKISVSSDHVLVGDEVFEATMKHRRELGLITSIYYCVGIYPNTFIRSNLAEAAWTQWKTVATDSDGYLRWAYDSFVADPFATTDFKTWESGDTAQVYPGNVSSVRWERMNEGIRDAEKVRRLSEQSPEAAAELKTALLAMGNPGVKKDPFGGVIDPGDVDIPAEVDRLEAALEQVTREFLEARNPLELTATAQARCIGSKAVLAVTARNDEAVPMSITFTSTFGSKSFATVAAGKNATHVFTTRSASIPEGTVTIDAVATIDGSETSSTSTATFAAKSCSN
ncbi:glycoside hydrolase domain-containing protein [Agromyces subbeticus]|uniref:glycoside hydrolase domain-containing protein n=1 Tax=Agromyces subbeticus TaxID=293890 RepID=UPI00146D3747|nr:glycoside hydrolase domain-containing protein [Agromyces subbeticus]